MENLLFFNKKGHPYNFTYNNDKWEGKLLFDENASDTFKTIGMYIFEKVDPIEYTSSSDFLKLTYYDTSGITFTSKSNYSNLEISGITKVNNSSEFYSKWIIGDKFDKKFPKGTIISFDNVTGDTSYSSDFASTKYFQVISNRKDSIMIITDSNNNNFDFSFSAGTISNTYDVISINDYNRNLNSTDFFQNLYYDKKLSIVNSSNNDKVFGITKSGLTYTYLNDIKITGSTTDTLKLRLYFLTERPKLYEGDVILKRYSTGENQITLSRLNSNFDTESNFVIEDRYGNDLYSGYTFNVTSIKSDVNLSTKKINFLKINSSISVRPGKRYSTAKVTTTDYRLQFDGYLNIKDEDIITLSATTLTNHLNHNKSLKILDTHFYNGIMTLRVKGSIIAETGKTYSIIKNLKDHQKTKMIVSSSGYIPYGYNKFEQNAIIYSTNNYLDFTQEILTETGTSYYNTIQSFVSRYNTIFNNEYGINIYYTKKGNDGYLSIESLYGTYKPYIYVSGYTNSNNLTNDFSLSTNGFTERYDIFSNSSNTNERTCRNENDKLNRKSSASIMLNLNYNSSNYGFKLTLNTNEYFIRFTGNTQTTINSFVSKWYDIIYRNGFEVYSGYTASGVYSGYTLNISGIDSDSNIYDLEMNVNLLSNYYIKYQTKNKGILLSGNELRSNSINYFSIGLSTGMIINVSGSSFNDNNKDYNIIGLTEDKISLSYQGPFYNDNNVNIIGETREFLRKPRGTYNKDIYFKISWIPIDDRKYPIEDSIFFYDMSGTQLKPPKDNNGNYIESLRYIGPIPIISAVTNNTVFLNEYPNKDKNKNDNPKYQQTIFKNLEYKLEQLDSSSSYNWVPEPLEFFIGYNSTKEGVHYNNLKIEKIEKIENTDIPLSISGLTTPGYGSINNFYLTGNTLIFDNPQLNFINKGFEVGQTISIKFTDQSTFNQQIFESAGNYTIEYIGRNKFTLDKSGHTFNTTGDTFKYIIEVLPKEIANVSVYGQTEVEDVRFKINLNNVGVQISDDTAKIFKESDIKDNTVDYKLLNRKRKEMLSTYREIYDYIGSYKGLVNAINYFGYTDLQLYEYYRNIDKSSQLYKKLQKVLIPDIFDNTIEGWNEIDFISGKYQNQTTWTKTNLFNLTYRITDKNGNNIITYTLDEVQYKLNKLKNWLRNNVIPISANLLDITGVVDVPQNLYQDYDESNQVKGSHITRNSTIVNFNYTSTLNFGTNYLISVNFYVISGGTSNTNVATPTETPDFYTAKIKTFYLSGNTMIPVQYHKLRKDDLTPYSFNIDKLVDPYIYIETTSFSNDGSGLGVKNNKMYYFDEPKNHWLVNHNFDMSKYKYILNSKFITNNKQEEEIALYKKKYSTAINTSVETNIKISTKDRKIK